MSDDLVARVDAMVEEVEAIDLGQLRGDQPTITALRRMAEVCGAKVLEATTVKREVPNPQPTVGDRRLPTTHI